MDSENTLYIAKKTRKGFYEQVVLKFLSRLTKGRLDLLLPDGESMSIGDGEGAIRAQMRIKDSEFFKRCVLYGDLGFGEAYADNLWDTGNILAVISWFLLNLDNAPRTFLRRRRTDLVSHNNEFFRIFLDPSLTYSGAYFERDGMTLEEAQQAKHRRLCEHLHLRPTDHVLDTNGGWGSNAIYIARHYGCQVTSLTTCEEQHRLATQLIKKEGLEHLITIRLEELDNLSGRRFDKIISIEPQDTSFQKCHELLKQNGIMALQVITSPDSHNTISRTDEMILIDAKELGLHYAATLKVWFMQFNSRLTAVRALGFDERFIRKWNYYLCYREAAFRMRNSYLMQLVYTPRPKYTGPF